MPAAAPPGATIVTDVEASVTRAACRYESPGSAAIHGVAVVAALRRAARIEDDDPLPREPPDDVPDLAVVGDPRQHERERQRDDGDRDADHRPPLPPCPLLLAGLLQLDADELVLRVLGQRSVDLAPATRTQERRGAGRGERHVEEQARRPQAAGRSDSSVAFGIAGNRRRAFGRGKAVASSAYAAAAGATHRDRRDRQGRAATTRGSRGWARIDPREQENGSVGCGDLNACGPCCRARRSAPWSCGARRHLPRARRARRGVGGRVLARSWRRRRNRGRSPVPARRDGLP